MIPAMYFGQPYGPGHVSEEFPDTVSSMYSKTDDVIFFSELLGTDLMEHGEGLMSRYKKLAKPAQLKISSLDFSEARTQGLMPDPDEYQDWLKGF